MDKRHISMGTVVPSEAYCDQVYVVKTNDGAWLAAMTTGKGKEGQQGQHIVAARSLDEGNSWGSAIQIEPADGPEASYAVLLKTESGRVYAFYNYNTDRVKEVQSEEGYAFNRVDCVGDYVFKYSDDHGLTWSDKRYKADIREFAVDRENIHAGRLRFFWNVGRPAVGGDGKVFLPHTKVAAMGEGFYAQSEGSLLCSPNIMREPDPEKIRFETLPDGDVGLRTPSGGGRISEEQSCVLLSDGSLYCVYRSTDGFPVCSYSRDEGKTWGPPAYKTYRPGGRAFKHPRAANFVWRCKNGRYLYWFHNHGGGLPARGNWNAYHDRNPVWLTAGREIETADGVVLEWAQPEIILYDDDPCIRMSYPDLIEDNGSYFVTETQKTVARIHRLDPGMLKLLFQQHELAEVSREGLVLELAGTPALPDEVDMPTLPDFYVRDTSREDQAGQRTRAGFSIELRLDLPLSEPGNTILLDTVSENARGLRIQTKSQGRLSLEMSDGKTACSWTSQRHALTPGGKQTVALVVDGGPGIISCLVDGELLDGGSELQFGWGRFSPYLMQANGKGRATLAANLLFGLRIYNRALLTSEAVGNWRSAGAALTRITADRSRSAANSGGQSVTQAEPLLCDLSRPAAVPNPGKKKGELSLSSSINILGYRTVFGLLTKVRPPQNRPVRLGPGSRVLVFSTAGLGDSLLDSAGIRALASEYPGIHIQAVVHHRRTDMARHNPLLEKLHFLRKGPHAFLALWWRLRKHGPWDAVLYFSCHDPEARCLGYLLSPDATIGLAWRTKMPWLCAKNLSGPGLQRAHLAVQALRVAAEAGATTGEARMVYEVAADDRTALDKTLAGWNFPSKPGVTFQLGGGGGPHRDWPAEHFFKLAELAHAGGIGPIFLLGGPDHRKKADGFSAMARGLNIPFYDVVGRLPLPLSAALLERSRCLVSTDTGIMHLAFALGTPTVALLHCSPGDARVGPLADRDRHAVIQLSKPAGYRVPSDASMRDLRPEDVFPGLKELFFRNP